MNDSNDTSTLHKAPFFIAIAGNIGVGKTTLTQKISEHFKFKAFFERIINNPYLDDFYNNMERWSFNLQVYFLSQRFIDQKAISTSTLPCVQDRSIYEDAEIFAYILYKQGFMSPRDYNNYRELFYNMTDYLRKPDLVLYLRASTWTLISRIRKRGREYEKKITKDYLFELNEAYERWINSIKNDFNVLTIDADDFDLDKRPHMIFDVYSKIQHKIDLYNQL